MSSTLEVNDWQMFTILTWKNFYVCLKNYEMGIFLPLVPTAFSLLLVIIRLLATVKYRPSKIYRKLDVNRTWTRLISDIERRREIIRRHIPTFDHNPYVPQLTIAVAPSDFEYRDVIEQAEVEYIRGMDYVAFETCNELKEAMKKEHYFAGVCFFLDFTASTNLEITYVFPSELRIYNDSYIGANWDTNSLYDNFNTFNKRMLQGHDGGYVGYLREGFLAIQNAVAMVYMKREFEQFTPIIKLQRFPFHSHIDDCLTGSWKVSISLVLILGHLYPVLIITYRIVKEKKANGKTILKVLGISNWVQMSSWYTVFFTLTFISSLIISSLLKIDWLNGRSILPQVNIAFLIMCFFAYNAATISFCMMISAFFSEPKHAVPFVGIIWVSSFVPYVAYFNKIEWFTNLWPIMYMLCNTVLAFIFDQIMEYERLSNHIPITYWSRSPYSAHKLCGVAYIGLMLALSVLYILIAFYVENLHFDVCEHLRIRYLISRPRREITRRTSRRAFMREGMVYEIEPEYKKIIIRAENLCKVYDGEYAVKDVSLNIFEGDITVIMGHNGSGKTVLLKMLAGLLMPTSGKIFIGNSNVELNKMSRRIVGVSLYDTLLFPELSVFDQLTLFARLRGLTSNALKKDVLKYLNAMNLYNRRDSMPKNLNKGERQFLSVCCALVGKTKIVLLDEPSKWLDALAKRALWELLRSESKTKTIILTTNNEEEVESLADRIGIFCWGELKCFGSSFFLKKVYGQGHRLILYREKNFDKEKVTETIQKYEPNSNIESEMGIQVTYILNDIASFIALADELEDRSIELGINGISISEMNSADIFFKKGAQDPTDGDRLRHSEMMNGDTIYFRNSSARYFDTGKDRVTGRKLFFNQCKVLLQKRMLSTIRIFQQSLLQLIVPILLTTVSFSLLNYQENNKNLKKLEFTLQQYPNSETFYHISDEGYKDRNKNVSYIVYQEELFWMGNAHKEKRIPRDVENIYQYMLNEQAERSDLENNKCLIGVIFDKKDITALFHNFPLHTAPLSLNLVHNAILRSGTSALSMKTYLSPLPFDSKHRAVRGNIPLSIAKYLAIHISFCVGFSWTICVIFLVRERRKHFKFYQQLMGVRTWVFWLNHFVYDIFGIMITTFLIVITCILFEIEPFGQFRTTITFFMALFLAGVFMCSANYLMSLIWNDPVMAYITISLLNALGTMNYWIYIETYATGFKKPESNIYEKMGRIFPHFSLCNALVKSLTLSELDSVCQNEALRIISIEVEKCQVFPSCCESFELWSFKQGILSELSFIFAYGVICWVLLILSEYFNKWTKKLSFAIKRETPQRHISNFSITSWSRSPPKRTFIETIENEKEEVLNMDPETYKKKVLICKEMHCEIAKNFVFNDVTFTVNRAESFIILGRNGSGKTILMSTLLGAVPLTSGSIQIDGITLNTSKKDTYQRIGYCPPEDVFLPEFRLIELIEMMCLLKGIPAKKIKNISENLAKLLGLYNQLGKRLKICSAGVRRRFFFACALIGDPQLVLFDDISTSLDIASQRQVWKAIDSLRVRGRSAILTSTTARDCECVADRFLILSEGRPILITDPLSLSDFYKSGYILKMKIKKVLVSLPNQTNDWIVPKYQSFSANPFIKVATFIENEFPVFQIKEKLGNIIEYFIPKTNNTISKIFRLMQRNAFNLYVEDFTITTYTLPMLFIEILENEKEETSIF